MKHLIFTCTFLIFSLSYIKGQDTMMMKKDMLITTDSTKSCCSTCYTNLFSAGGKYYFNTLKNTRTTISQNGFILN